MSRFSFGGIIVSRHHSSASIPIGAIPDGLITFAKLLSTIFSGQLQSSTNAGTAGGSIYYINLGGIKIAFGITTTSSHTSSGYNARTVTFPSGFFSATPYYMGTTLYGGSSQGTLTVAAQAASASGMSVTTYNTTASTASAQIAWLAIGI